MKHMKRANIYQASSYNCTFNPETCEAYSYKWWCFVKRIGGKVVFNQYRYSVSTSKHQSKVRALMRELGIQVERYVEIHGNGLNGIDTLLELNQAIKNSRAEFKRREELSRIRRNERARVRRAQRKAQAVALVTHAAHESQARHMTALRLVQGGVA